MAKIEIPPFTLFYNAFRRLISNYFFIHIPCHAPPFWEVLNPARKHFFTHTFSLTDMLSLMSF